MNEEKRGFCGGTILTDYIILTAAHCINQSRYIYVVLGESQAANHCPAWEADWPITAGREAEEITFKGILLSPEMTQF